ncbi:MAG TPA: hypothetical protein PL188_10975 [Candidatus Cloacimonadota bacterium]|nr:hypothetical protein [Candidatus Cloacimonadota bacterium]
MSMKRTLEIIHCPDCSKAINAPLEACFLTSTDNPYAPILFIQCSDCGRTRQMQVHALPLPIDHANVVFSAVIQLLAVEFLNEKRISIESAYVDSVAPPTPN